MSDGDPYREDPFDGDEFASEPGRLATETGQDDGWDPVGDDGFTPDSPLEQLEALMMQTDDPPARTEITSSGTFDTPAHYNPLPDDNAGPTPRTVDPNDEIMGGGASAAPLPPLADIPAYDGAEDPFEEPARTSTGNSQTTRMRRPSRVSEAFNSNEAIVGSDAAQEVHRSSMRQRLPSRADAPSHPMDTIEVPARSSAWAVPASVLVLGSGAGALVFYGANPILGSIAVALSIVGALFLRVLLKG